MRVPQDFRFTFTSTWSNAFPENLCSQQELLEGESGRSWPLDAPSRARSPSLPCAAASLSAAATWPGSIGAVTEVKTLPCWFHSRSHGEEVGLRRVHLRHPWAVLGLADGKAAAGRASAGGESFCVRLAGQRGVSDPRG